MLSLSMVQNETGVFLLSVFQADGVTPQSLVGSTLWFHAAYPPSGFQLNKSSPSSGIAIQNPAGGSDCATLQIEPSDTAALGLSGTAVVVMAAALVLQNGSEAYPLATGTFLMTANVGTP